jgi:hypothetical protein
LWVKNFFLFVQTYFILDSRLLLSAYHLPIGSEKHQNAEYPRRHFAFGLVQIKESATVRAEVRTVAIADLDEPDLTIWATDLHIPPREKMCETSIPEHYNYNMKRDMGGAVFGCPRKKSVGRWFSASLKEAWTQYPRRGNLR